VKRPLMELLWIFLCPLPKNLFADKNISGQNSN
jgi:hypothetical protein